MQIIETHTVPTLIKKIRLQEYAVAIFRTLSSRAGIKKAIKRGRVYVNAEMGHTGDWILGGETIDLLEADSSKKPSIDIRLEVLFEDDYLAVVYKPAGILVSGNKRFTIENALAFNLSKSSQPDALARPEPIHRLDYPTTGALLIGKTVNLVMALNKLFENQKIIKTYHAVTMGAIKESGIISSKIDDKAAQSHYTVLKTVASKKYIALNLVRLQPTTGRRHQLRKHLSEIGSPILGDKEYGEQGKILNGRGLYLHASSLTFLHPSTKEQLNIEASLPKKFEQLFFKMSTA